MPRNILEIRNATADSAELVIYDEIGFFGMSSKSFYMKLKELETKKIVVRINSPGGSVVDGYAIYNLLKAHKAKIEVRIDGIAASIASFIAMAGDTIIMPENSLMFIHNPLIMGFVEANAEELKKLAGDLEKIGEQILNTYVARAGGEEHRKKISRMLEDETLLTAAEAVELKLADVMEPALQMAARFNIKDYFPNTTFAAQSSGGSRNQNNHQGTMTPEEQATLTAAQTRATTLEAENTRLNAQHAAALDTAKTSARQEVINAEKQRRSAIIAMRDKYNKDGDLDDITVKALSGETTVAEFQTQVMDVINDRPTKAAIKPSGGGGGGGSSFVDQYKAAKTEGERRALRKKYPNEAREIARSA